jgi:hypothetical protein
MAMMMAFHSSATRLPFLIGTALILLAGGIAVMLS